MNRDELKTNITSSKHWLRLFFMLIFAAILQLASMVMGILVVAQFIFSLLTGKDNLQLRRFGYSLSAYIFDTLRFLTYNADEKPFPFADWPRAEDAPAPDVTEKASDEPRS